MGGVRPSFRPTVLIFASRPAVSGSNERVALATLIAIRIEENSFDIVVVRTFPVDYFGFGDRLVLESGIQVGDLERRGDFYAIEARAKELRGRAGGGIFVDERFAVVTEREAEKMFQIFGRERFSRPSITVASELCRFCVHAIHKQGNKSVRSGFERTSETAIPVEIDFGSFCGSDIVEINPLDGSRKEFRVV